MGPGFGSFPRESSYPSLFLPYCCKYFNKTEKEKKDKKKSKKRKISSLEATGHLQPRPARTFSGTEQRPALAARTSCIVHPSQGGQPPEPLLHSREQQRNKEPVLPGTGPVTSALSVLHQSALLGRVPHCLPRWPGDSLTPKDAFAEMAALPL